MKFSPPAVWLDGPPGANSGAMQSRGQFAIAAEQPVQTGIGSLKFLKLAEVTPASGAIPQPGLGPVWLALVTGPASGEPDVAPVLPAPLVPVPPETPVEPAVPAPLPTPELGAPVLGPGAVVSPPLAPDPTLFDPDCGAVPLVLTPLPVPMSPLDAPLPPPLLPDVAWLPPPTGEGLPPHATATRRAIQGMAREKDR